MATPAVMQNALNFAVKYILPIFEMAVLINFVASLQILFLIIQIYFGYRKRELTLLNDLYRVFWSREIDTTGFKKGIWDETATKINVFYLADRYIGFCNRRKIESIAKMKYGTTLGEDREKWFKLAAKRISLFIVISGEISCAIDLWAYKRLNKVVLVNVIVVIVLLVVIWIQLPAQNDKPLKATAICVLRLASDTWGYQITKKGPKKKETLIQRVPLIGEYGLYNRYIRSMNSLIAFFYLWINYGDSCAGETQTEKAIKEQYLQLIKDFQYIKNKNLVTYQPIFVIGGIMFEHGICVNELRTIYTQMVTDEEKKTEFCEFMKGQFSYMERCCCEQDLLIREMKLSKFLSWLEETVGEENGKTVKER